MARSILFITSAVLFVIAVCLVVSVRLAPNLYTGRTRVMESQPNQGGVPVPDKPPKTYRSMDAHSADLVNIATSNTVISRSVQSLGDLGITVDPAGLAKNLRVQPIADTEILQIEFTSSDRDESKAVADVVASQFQRHYKEINKGKNNPSIQVIDAAYSYPVDKGGAIKGLAALALLVPAIILLIIGIVLRLQKPETQE